MSTVSILEVDAETDVGSGVGLTYGCVLFGLIAVAAISTIQVERRATQIPVETGIVDDDRELLAERLAEVRTQRILDSVGAVGVGIIPGRAMPSERAVGAVVEIRQLLRAHAPTVVVGITMAVGGMQVPQPDVDARVEDLVFDPAVQRVGVVVKRLHRARAAVEGGELRCRQCEGAKRRVRIHEATRIAETAERGDTQW